MSFLFGVHYDIIHMSNAQCLKIRKDELLSEIRLNCKLLKAYDPSVTVPSSASINISLSLYLAIQFSAH